MLWTRKTAPDIPATPRIEGEFEDSTDLFRPEASPDTSQPAFESPAQSRALAWLLLSAPVVAFLLSWFLADTESARRTAIAATGQVRSAIASMAAWTSLALQPGRPSGAEPPRAADELEPAPAPPGGHDDNSSSQPTPEQPASTPAPTERAAPPSPAPASSNVPVASPAANGLLAGTLSIESRPVGASVFVDGQPVGTTPVLLPQISPGMHVVRLQLAAHREWSASVQVVPHDRNRVTASLEADENAPGP